MEVQHACTTRDGTGFGEMALGATVNEETLAQRRSLGRLRK